MSFLLATFRKDIARWRQDRTAILLWIGLPFMIGGLITSMVDQDGGGPMGTLLIADLDDTLLSGFVAGAFSQDEMADLIGVQQVTPEEGTRLIEAGEASGFLTIPEGFQDAFIDNMPMTLTLKTNPSQTILPGIIEDITEVLLDVGFYLQSVFGDEIRQIKAADLPDTLADAFASDMAVQIQQKIRRLESKVFPPVIEVEIVEPPPQEPRPDIALLFLPGIVLMALMFSAQGLSADYWKERDSGALRRLVSTPGRLSRFVLGKALAADIAGGLHLSRHSVGQDAAVDVVDCRIGRWTVRVVCGNTNVAAEQKSSKSCYFTYRVSFVDDGRQFLSARCSAGLDGCDWSFVAELIRRGQADA